MEGINLQRFTRGLTENLEPPVRQHLKNVYATFTLAGITAAAGAYVHLYSTLIGAGMLTSLLALGSLLWLMMTPHDGKNQLQRLSLLGVFAFFSGCNLGPLINMAMIVNQTLVLQALLGTSVVFGCFSLAALFAPRGHYLYLGGILFSGLSTLFWLSMLNIFFGSQLIYQVNLYVGLFVMCGFIVFDTQNITEKARSGDKDYVMHSVELFIDFVGVFRRLLIILTEKEVHSQKKRRRD